MRLLFVLLLSFTSNVIFSQLTAEFSATPLEVCIGESIDFNDLSTAGASPIEFWTYDFGDGTDSNLPNPSHTYAIPGTYNVTLTIQAFDGTSDFEVKPAYVVVYDIPNIGYTSIVNGCALPVDITLNNSSTSGVNMEYDWDFGNGQTSTDFEPTGITYTTAGSFTITLDILDSSTGCSNSETQNVIINDFQGGIVAPATACVGESVQIDDASTTGSNSWGWTFGDGGSSSLQNDSHVYNSAGTYDITLSVSNTVAGCTDVVTQSIEVFPLPVPSFTASETVGCAPFDVDFTNTSVGGVTYDWTFGNGDSFTGETPPNQQYTTQGFFDVSLTMTDANGCSNTTTINNMIEVDEIDVAFSADVVEGCAPLDVQFTDNSTPFNPSDPITGWTWSFGNGGGFSGDVPPIQTYASGVYDVTLTVTTDNGCTADTTYTQYIQVGDITINNINVNPIDDCAKSEFNFTSDWTIVDPHDPNDVEYEWDFGDGGNSTEENPTYNYPQDTGFFDVQLIVDYRGCKDTLEIIDMVYVRAPISMFTAESVCNPASFPVSINVTDNAIIGALTDDAEMIYTWDDGSTTTLTDAELDAAGSGSTAHDYADYGTYTIQQAIYNTTTGCEDSTTTVITISQTVADFTITADSVCIGSSVTVNDASSSSHPFGTYLYTMGNGASLGGASVSYTYPSTGSFDITLTATNSVGCADSYTYIGFDVLSLPVASFTASDIVGCTPLDVDFTNSSTIQGNGVPIESYLWTFYDFSTAATTDASFTFNDLGTYATQLVATDEFGCVSAPASVNVSLTKPVADFSMDTVLCNNANFVTSNASGGVGPLSYEWNLDGSQVSIDQTYSDQFNETETPSINVADHNIELIVTDANGCKDTAELDVHVSMPYADVNYNFTSASAGSNGVYTCPPVFAELIDVSSSYGSISSWDWVFGNGNTSVEQNTAQNTYVFAGTYSLNMTITDQWGCMSDTTLFDYLTISGPSADADWINVGDICEPLYEFSMTNGVNVDMIEWDLGDGQIVTDEELFQYVYNGGGTYNPVLTITDDLGCEVDVPMNEISILNNNLEVAIGSSMPFGNAGEEFIFSNTITGGSTPVAQWDWDFVESSISNTNGADVPYTWFIPGEYPVVLVVTDQNGCIATDTLLVPVSDELNVPNVFTPNGDGINDIMTIDYDVFDGGYDYFILNRWGNVVHEAFDHKGLALWDGTTKSGKECVDGVYFYKIKGKIFGEETVKQGYVTLLRGF